MQVWLGAATMTYPQAGGNLWIFLNWALGLRSLGCDVVWLEGLDGSLPIEENQRYLEILRNHLRPYGLSDRVSLCPEKTAELPPSLADSVIDWRCAEEADLFLNLAYSKCDRVLPLVRRSAMIDIDPG